MVCGAHACCVSTCPAKVHAHAVPGTCWGALTLGSKPSGVWSGAPGLLGIETPSGIRMDVRRGLGPWSPTSRWVWKRAQGWDGLAHLVLERAVCRQMGRAQSPLSLYFSISESLSECLGNRTFVGFWSKQQVWEIRPGPDRYHTAAVPSGCPLHRPLPSQPDLNPDPGCCSHPVEGQHAGTLPEALGSQDRAAWGRLALALNRASEASAEALSLVVDFFLFNCDDFELLPT